MKRTHENDRPGNVALAAAATATAAGPTAGLTTTERKK